MGDLSRTAKTNVWTILALNHILGIRNHSGNNNSVEYMQLTCINILIVY